LCVSSSVVPDRQVALHRFDGRRYRHEAVRLFDISCNIFSETEDIEEVKTRIVACPFANLAAFKPTSPLRGFPAAFVFAVCLMALSGSAFSQFIHVPVPGLPGASAGSIAWGDYDNDGRLDFLLCGSLELSLWHNNGNGFSNVTASLVPGLKGMYDSCVAWGDFDNDGRLDLLITGLTNLTMQGISQLWRNTGHGFTKVPIPGLPGIAQSSVAWCDFDRDGRLDFLITGSTNGIGTGALTQLWRNTGNGFTNVPVPGLPGIWQGSIAWGDFDNDGWPDFLITGITNGASGGSVSQLWRNTGTGFTNMPIPGLRGVYVSSVVWGDYDNDGLLDFLLEGLSGNSFISELWRNTGSGFTNVPVPGLPGIADGSLAWGDFNNDGRLDFQITGLTNGVTEVSQVWLNTGNGFTNMTDAALPGSFDNSLGLGDFDNDGRLDFLIAGSIEGVSQLWRNITPSSNSPPTAPTELLSSVFGDTATLTWKAPQDDHTPAAGLSYNLRVGTTPSGSEIVEAPALANGKLLVPQMGSTRRESIVLHHLRPGQTYYWSAQAVDTSFAGSPFAAEQQFNSSQIVVNKTSYTNGAFQFAFSGTQGGNFAVITTTNASLPPNQWTVVGAVTETSSGQFQFTDTQALNHSQRIYRVRSPKP
jgi:hypothetical protein